MNPFSLNPRLVTTPAAAASVLKLYDNEIAQSVALTAHLQDNLSAIVDVMKQAHPDLADDLDLLVESAKYVGDEEGRRVDLDTMKSQFRLALPWAVKKALETPTQ
jgi:hypothetical protein